MQSTRRMRRLSAAVSVYGFVALAAFPPVANAQEACPQYSKRIQISKTQQTCRCNEGFTPDNVKNKCLCLAGRTIRYDRCMPNIKAGKQPADPPVNGSLGWLGLRGKLTKADREKWIARNADFLLEASLPFDKVSADDIAEWVLWEWKTHYLIDMAPDIFEHWFGTKGPTFARAEGLGISNLRPDNLLRKTKAAARLVHDPDSDSDKRIPGDIKKLAREAIRDKDKGRYRELLYENKRFSFFILGQTMEVLHRRFEKEGYKKVPYEAIKLAIERNAFSKGEIDNVVRELARKYGVYLTK